VTIALAALKLKEHPPLMIPKEVRTTPVDLKEIIDQLKLERSILKDGGYGRSVHTPWKEERLFRDSVTYLNLGREVKRHPCDECLLWEWAAAAPGRSAYPFGVELDST
jgi:hypothetical protein